MKIITADDAKKLLEAIPPRAPQLERRLWWLANRAELGLSAVEHFSHLAACEHVANDQLEGRELLCVQLGQLFQELDQEGLEPLELPRDPQAETPPPG